MTTNTEITALVNSYTAVQYGVARTENAIVSAALFISVKIGEDIETDTTVKQYMQGIALLAANRLNEGRRVELLRNDAAVTLSMDEMYTDEIKSIVEVGDVNSPNLIRVTSINPTDDWVA